MRERVRGRVGRSGAAGEAERLATENAALRAENAQLRSANSALRQRIDALTAKIGVPLALEISPLLREPLL